MQNEGQKQGAGSRQLEPGKRKSADHWTLFRRMVSEHSGVCRRAELPGRSVKAEFRKVDGYIPVHPLLLYRDRR